MRQKTRIRLAILLILSVFIASGCDSAVMAVGTGTSRPTATAIITRTIPHQPASTPVTITVEIRPVPTPTPLLPEEAFIDDFTAHGQLLSLDCEARTAVDWAAYFGYTILEYDYYTRLPRSLDPNEGFVGSVHGAWGSLPPGDYGVHAGPVAALLRQYGVDAKAQTGMSWDELAAEIAAGRPVMVWVTGHTQPGKREYYSVPGGKTVLVAAREHTVVVTGYTEATVTIRDGNQTYNRTREQFLQSWQPLDFMAITFSP